MKRGYLALLAGLVLANLASAGNISGIVKFSGDKAERKLITEIAANAFCKEACAGKENLSERFVYGKHGDDDTLANVLVYVSKDWRAGDSIPQGSGRAGQVNCAYVPHVVGIMAGQTLEIRNSDATLHNVMTQPRNNKGFNDGMPGTGLKLPKVFDKPELSVALRCFMHPWMLGYVHVLDHPFYARDGQGWLV